MKYGTVVRAVRLLFLSLSHFFSLPDESVCNFVYKAALVPVNVTISSSLTIEEKAIVTQCPYVNSLSPSLTRLILFLFLSLTASNTANHLSNTHTSETCSFFFFYDASVLLTHALSSSLAGSFIVPSPLPAARGILEHLWLLRETSHRHKCKYRHLCVWAVTTDHWPLVLAVAS